MKMKVWWNQHSPTVGCFLGMVGAAVICWSFVFSFAIVMFKIEEMRSWCLTMFNIGALLFAISIFLPKHKHEVDNGYQKETKW